MTCPLNHIVELSDKQFLENSRSLNVYVYHAKSIIKEQLQIIIKDGVLVIITSKDIHLFIVKDNVIEAWCKNYISPTSLMAVSAEEDALGGVLRMLEISDEVKMTSYWIGAGFTAPPRSFEIRQLVNHQPLNIPIENLVCILSGTRSVGYLDLGLFGYYNNDDSTDIEVNNRELRQSIYENNFSANSFKDIMHSGDVSFCGRLYHYIKFGEKAPSMKGVLGLVGFRDVKLKKFVEFGNPPFFLLIDKGLEIIYFVPLILTLDMIQEYTAMHPLSISINSDEEGIKIAHIVVRTGDAIVGGGSVPLDDNSMPSTIIENFHKSNPSSTSNSSSSSSSSSSYDQNVANTNDNASTESESINGNDDEENQLDIPKEDIVVVDATTTTVTSTTELSNYEWIGGEASTIKIDEMSLPVLFLNKNLNDFGSQRIIMSLVHPGENMAIGWWLQVFQEKKVIFYTSPLSRQFSSLLQYWINSALVIKVDENTILDNIPMSSFTITTPEAVVLIQKKGVIYGLPDRSYPDSFEFAAATDGSFPILENAHTAIHNWIASYSLESRPTLVKKGTWLLEYNNRKIDSQELKHLFLSQTLTEKEIKKTLQTLAWAPRDYGAQVVISDIRRTTVNKTKEEYQKLYEEYQPAIKCIRDKLSAFIMDKVTEINEEECEKMKAELRKLKVHWDKEKKGIKSYSNTAILSLSSYIQLDDMPNFAALPAVSSQNARNLGFEMDLEANAEIAKALTADDLVDLVDDPSTYGVLCLNCTFTNDSLMKSLQAIRKGEAFESLVVSVDSRTRTLDALTATCIMSCTSGDSNGPLYNDIDKVSPKLVRRPIGGFNDYYDSDHSDDGDGQLSYNSSDLLLLPLICDEFSPCDAGFDPRDYANNTNNWKIFRILFTQILSNGRISRRLPPKILDKLSKKPYLSNMIMASILCHLIQELCSIRTTPVTDNDMEDDLVKIIRCVTVILNGYLATGKLPLSNVYQVVQKGYPTFPKRMECGVHDWIFLLAHVRAAHKGFNTQERIQILGNARAFIIMALNEMTLPIQNEITNRRRAIRKKTRDDLRDYQARHKFVKKESIFKNFITCRLCERCMTMDGVDAEGTKHYIVDEKVSDGYSRKKIKESKQKKVPPICIKCTIRENAKNLRDDQEDKSNNEEWLISQFGLAGQRHKAVSETIEMKKEVRQLELEVEHSAQGEDDNKKENEMDVVISTEGKGVEELELVCKEITNNSDLLQTFLRMFPEGYVNLIENTIGTRIIEYTKLSSPLFIELLDLIGIGGDKCATTEELNAESLNEAKTKTLGQAFKFLLKNIADPNRMRKVLKHWNNVYPL